MHGRRVSQASGTVFRVVADVEPSSLPRIAGLLSLANVAPVSLHCVRYGEDRLAVCAMVEDITASTTDLIYRKLSQLTCVHECSVEIAT
jgi:hypothetical protein